MNKIEHTKKALIEAMQASLGIVTTACKKVGVSRGTFYKYYNEDTEFKAEVDDVEEMALDFVESQLFKQIKDDNTSATIFYLKTKGKKRGYIEGLQVSGDKDNPIQIVRRLAQDCEPLPDSNDNN